MNHWTDAKLCQLVTLYSQFNNLWDKNHPCYYDLRCRYDSYDEIRKSLSTPGLTVTHVLSKLWDLRKDYVAELRKVQLAKKSSYRPKKKWFYTMHQFFYDCLDSDEKPSEDSCTSESNISTENLEEDQECFENQNLGSSRGDLVLIRPSALEGKRMNETYAGRQNWGQKNAKPSRFGKSCVEFSDQFSWQGDEANLSKCCQDMMKGRNLKKGHFSKYGRKLYQDSIYDKVQKNTDKFSSRGSKRGQCTSSSCFEYQHQDHEDHSSKFRTLNSRVPTSPELRRSTPKPTSWKKEECPCCSNCYGKKFEVPTQKNLPKFNPQSSGSISRKSKCGRCNQNDHFREKEKNYDFEATVNISSSDSLVSKTDDPCEEENADIYDNLNSVPRVLCLDELSGRVVEALNEMFVKLCPTDIACFDSYCTNETCKSSKVKDKDIDKDKEKEKGKEKESTPAREKENVKNGKGNRQTEESSVDKTNSAEDDDFDQFGAEVARVLKQTNREKALKLKAAIKQTLESAKEGI